MMQKVEICGVDTSGLPLLTAKENEELMKKLKAGDKSAREKFIVGNMRLVLSLVKRFWAKNANADDVFQEVFLAYFQCGKHFQEEEHRRAWLLRTTLNFSRRVTASPWRRRVVPLSERADAPVQFQTPEQTGLWSALSSLPDGLRVPLYLFYFEELSTQEIARLLSLRPGAVRMRLSRGREHLRELLKGDYFHE